MTQTGQPALVRAIGRWSLAALVLNSIIGSSVFGLPSVFAGLTGRGSPLAVLLGGAVTAIIIACYAEGASQFTQAGGTYLYARVVFGRFAGIQVAWFWLLAALASRAGGADLFVIYLGEFWPQATHPIPRFPILTLLVGTVAGVNYRGVRAGTQVSNVFVVAKLLPLGIVCIIGALYLITTHRVFPAATPPAGTHDWLKAVLLLLLAYGGYEAALIPMSEAKEPRRHVVFALFVALVTVTLIYTLIQWVVIGALPDAAHSVRPLADAASIFMGAGGAAVVAIGALVSVFGYLSAGMLTGPRHTFALAEQGDFPLWFCRRAPKVSHSSFLDSFLRDTDLAACTVRQLFVERDAFRGCETFLSRTGVCGCACLRRKQPGAALFRLPGGLIFPILRVVICLVLFTRADLSKSLILAATFSTALLNWLFVRRGERVFSLT